MSEAVRDYVVEWVYRDIKEGVKRELDVPQRRDKVVSLVGPRRSGKTHYFLQLCRREKPASLYINFEDTRLAEIDYKQVRDVVRVFIEVTGNEPSNIFLDEIQNVENWERAVRSLLDQKKYRLYVTGSSSKLLPSEVATSLGGRTFSYIFLPFSFREYLSAVNVEVRKFMTGDETAVIKKNLHDYLEYGGFPEVVLEKEQKDKILKDYADLILYRDVVGRHGLKNFELAKFLVSFFLQNFSREFSVNRVFGVASRAGAGKNTVYNYVDKVSDTLAVFFVNKYSRRVYVREGWPKKAYLCDTGLARVGRFSPDMGKLMENAVFLELLRRTNQEPLLQIFYWHEPEKGGVDFVLKHGDRVVELLQVTYANAVDELEKRELKSLTHAASITGCANLLVITWDYHDRLTVDGWDVKCVPLWRWLLKMT